MTIHKRESVCARARVGGRKEEREWERGRGGKEKEEIGKKTFRKKEKKKKREKESKRERERERKKETERDREKKRERQRVKDMLFTCQDRER